MDDHWSVWISILIAVIVTVLTRHIRTGAPDGERLRQASRRELRIGYAIELGFRLVTVGMAAWFVLYLIRTEFWSDAKKFWRPALGSAGAEGSFKAAKKIILKSGDTMDVLLSLPILQINLYAKKTTQLYVEQMNAPKFRFFQHFWPVVGAISLILAIFAGFVGYQARAQFSIVEKAPRQEHPLLPPGVSLKPILKPVIGDLGGMPVTFPPGFVNNVEYEGDPVFGEKRKGPIPTRTHQSQFASLGFDVRVPDFEILSYKDREMDKRKYSIFNTPWIDVGITAGPFFGDGQFLERSVDWMNSNERYQYEKLPTKQFDLDVYTPVGVDKSLRDYGPGGRYRSSSNDKDMFVHYDAAGKVDVMRQQKSRCSALLAAFLLSPFFEG